VQVSSTQLPEGQNKSPSDTDDLIRPVAELDEKLQSRLTQEIAILFTDIRGSTTFFKIHGDIAGRLMMQRHYDMLFPIIEEHNGRVVKTVGDSIMATFSDPATAVKAAIAMQRKLFSYNATKPHEDPIRIRIGINFGKGIIEENDVFGDVVNVASKLVSVGESEQIVVGASIYAKLKTNNDLLFIPLKTEQPYYNDVTLNAYVVRWQEEEQLKEKEMTVLSLGMIRQKESVKVKEQSLQFDKQFPNYFFAVEKIVREKAFRTTITPRCGLQAIFEYAETALETAVEILPHLQKQQQAFHMGIHTGRILVEEVEIHGGEEALEARDKAGSFEIYLTQSTYTMVKDNLSLNFLPLPVRLRDGTMLYKLLMESSVKTAVEVPQSLEKLIGESECFYCASTQHEASSCPSKRIPHHTHSLNEIGYLAVKEMNSLFAKHLSTIVKPYQSDEDEIYPPRITDQQSDKFKVLFEGFFEINEVFQLRFLRKVWSSDTTDWNNFSLSSPHKRSGGFAWLGEDSLRVSKHSEALTMFNKALIHDIEDYKPHTGLGFLAIERKDLVRASHHFQRGLSCTSNPLQKSYLLLLLARIFELRGNLDDALDTVREALVTAPNFIEAQYRQAVILAKQGNIRNTIAIVKDLLIAKPEIYLRVLLDPGLTSIKKELDSLTNESFNYTRTQADQNIKSIKKSLAAHGEWFSKEDYEYKTAATILDQTEKLFDGNSYFGLLDVISYGLDIKDKLRSALKNRRKSIRRNLNSLQEIEADYENFLDRYCYKSLINYSDTFLLKKYGDLLNKARLASTIDSAENLREAQIFIKELFALSKKISTNKNKLHFLKMFFFSTECFVKFVSRFLLWSFAVSGIFCLVLLGYEAYSTSLSAFSKEAIADYCKFSFFCGTLFGAGAGVYWIYNNFEQLFSKVK
jgi:class 3 adenylate cyclase/tetratricopeptide (TPR) repeat protein